MRQRKPKVKLQANPTILITLNVNGLNNQKVELIRLPYPTICWKHTLDSNIQTD